MLKENLIGILGGAIFLSSWLFQIYETKKHQKPTFSYKFFLIRILGAIILLIESVRVNSIGFFLFYIGVILMMSYNISKLKNKKIS